MRFLSRTFQKTRILVAVTLLLSVSVPLEQYACGDTGETMTTSTLVVKTGDTPPCDIIPNGIHDRLCGELRFLSGCEGKTCTTETVEAFSVARADLPRGRDILLFSSDLLSVEEEGHAFRRTSFSSLISEGDGTARTFNPVPVRLRSLSFRL
jgi:hypothetical protein